MWQADTQPAWNAGKTVPYSVKEGHKDNSRITSFSHVGMVLILKKSMGTHNASPGEHGGQLGTGFHF